MPRSARYLLWHYATCTIPSLSAIPLPKCGAPWTDIHLPTALRAYGELNVLGDSGLARVSLLYSLFSISCFQLSSFYKNKQDKASLESIVSSSLDQPTSSSHWEIEARKFRNIAQAGFRRCLQSLSTRKGAKQKYKEIFIAAMSIVCTAVGQVFPSVKIAV